MQENGAFRRQETLSKRTSLAVLFLERALAWLRPGGRLALIMPTGMLGIERDRYARAWLLERVRLQAVIELPVETFQAESGTHTGTSILLARKLTESERQHNDDYRIFMAVVSNVGYDSRGRVRYKYDAAGDLILHEGQPVVDNDLPLVLRNYQHFLNSCTTHILVHLPQNAVALFEQTVETLFGWRPGETFADVDIKEVCLHYTHISTDPPEGYKRFEEFLAQQKQVGNLKDFAPLRK